MRSTYVVHHHKAGKAHFDLRILQNEALRSWSLLKEPPCRIGERRLAIERESLPAAVLNETSIEEQAFGAGRVYIWDKGEVDIGDASDQRIILILSGAKLSGTYELIHMKWYPGDRWILQKTGPCRRKTKTI